MCGGGAQSRIERAPGDRVKTDRRDAIRLARLLRMGELVEVRVPTLGQEAARDLVRAREDARGDLMRARHRVSKLLLRHGLVWDRATWTQAHLLWLSEQRFEQRPLQLAYEEAVSAMTSECVPVGTRLSRAIVEEAAAEVGADRRSARLSARRQHPDRVWPGGRGRRVGSFHRPLDWCLPGPGAKRGLKRPTTQPRRYHQDRQHARSPALGGGSVASPPPDVASQP